jgi:hypothetical protein
LLCDAFGRPVVLLNDVAEVLDLAHFNGLSTVFVDRVHGGFVGATFVHYDLLWLSVLNA